ncbi:MAG: hypothetical protein U0841_15365 [Chloroflexia bacterium]
MAALIAAGLAATLLPLAGSSLVVSAALFVGWRGLTGFARADLHRRFYTIMQTVPPPPARPGGERHRARLHLGRDGGEETWLAARSANGSACARR